MVSGGQGKERECVGVGVHLGRIHFIFARECVYIHIFNT